MSLDNPIPYDDFSGQGPRIHFAHANGYLPGAYRQLLGGLGESFRVIAIRQRPLWPGSNPGDVQDWSPFVADLHRFFRELKLKQVIGIGHSLGATVSLHLALVDPQLFSALILIDPVIFPPIFNRVWPLIFKSGLAYRMHPLATGAARRRTRYPSKDAMYAGYRNKLVFQRLSDASLWDYVDSLAVPTADGWVGLAYPTDWEARIYVTGANADGKLWQILPKLQMPILVLRGEESDTFWKRTAQRFQRCLPQATLLTVPSTGHLLPLEKPSEVAQSILSWLYQKGDIAAQSQPDSHEQIPTR